MNNRVYPYIKRLLDIFISLLALLFFSPVFLVVWLRYTFGSDRGPMIYKQLRVGKGNKLFYIYKFRSMIVNADEELRNNKELYAKYVANNYKLLPEEDPRITKFGIWLRKTSIDEIPQFINILKGDMSIVGPRPVVKEELSEYGNHVDELLSIRPGAMGLWQACGRSNIGYPKRAEIELFYVKHYSLILDIKIIVKNIINIFKGIGAY